VIRQQRAERRALSNRMALEFRIRSKLRELSIRRTDLGTLEIVHVEIREQMQSRLQLDDLDSGAAVVSDERLLPRDHQQVERIVVRPALISGKRCRLSRSAVSQRVEA
jgi:hypothetical protein